MKLHLSLAVSVYLTAAASCFAQSSYIFQLPGPNGLGSQLVGLGDNDFHRVRGPINGPAGSTRVVATPNGLKFYILAPGGIFSTNAAFAAISPVAAIAGGVSGAEITPDGKYLLAISDHFYILNAATDSLATIADTGVPVGSTPVAVAVSHDAKTAFVLSNATTGSVVSAINLSTFEPATSPRNFPSSATSIVLSSRGLLYVTTTDRLYEIDTVTLADTKSGQMTVTGSAGPLQFTPDGNSAYFLNQNPCSSCPPLFKLNVGSHSINGWLPADNSAPPAIDQILVAGNNKVFALSKGLTKLWDVTPTPLNLTPSVIGAIPTGSVIAAGVSNERPTARYLYLLISDHNFYRVNLASNGIEETSSLDPALGTILSFVPIPAQSGGVSLYQVNPTQNAAPGTVAVLIGQLLDKDGRPVLGAQATFSADPAVVIATPSLTTTSEGWAQTAVTAPSASGTYPVNLAIGALSATFQLVVGTGSSGGSSLISIYSGDGQLLRQNETTIETQAPLTVLITDADGNPLENVPVTFQVSEGIGSVGANGAVMTNKKGFASSNFTSNVLPGGVPFQLTKVTATSSFGAVEFYEVTHDALGNDLHPPNSLIVTPANQKLTIPQGGFISSAITASTFSGHTGQGIPNVGIRLTDPLDLTLPSKYLGCVGTSRGDNGGISRCDVQAFCQPAGTIPPNGYVTTAIIEVGEYKSYVLTATITNGTPAVLSSVFGNNQSGNPSDTLTLIARVADGCGLPVVNLSGLTWSISPGGSASFSSQQNVSDTNGNVTARVTLGATPGPLQVRVSGPNLPTVTFNLTTRVVVSGVSLVSGGGQNVLAGQAFPNPVVFVIRDDHNAPVQGLVVNFTASGGATVNPASATSNAQGQVQTTVTSGSVAGNIVVTATYNNLSATASLSTHPPGPDIVSTSFKNAASGAVGMTPCGLVTVTGNGIAPTVSGIVSGQNFFGLLQYSVAGLSMTANNVPVPIHSVANVGGVQQANFQAPCELTPGTATVVVTVNSVSTTVTGVPVVAVQPGIFTYAGPNNKPYGSVIRVVDGSLVTPSNPARRGEQYYMVVTGLGQVTPATATNALGTGTQNVNVGLAVGIHDLGVPVVSARYLAGYIGAYRVDFTIPLDAPLGPDQNLALGAYVDGNNLLFGNAAFLPLVISQ